MKKASTLCVCRHASGNHITSCPTAVLDLKKFVDLEMDPESWAYCSEKLTLEACAVEHYFHDITDCHARHYKVTLLVLCCSFLVLLCALISAFVVLRMQQSKVQNLANGGAYRNRLDQMKAGWAKALQWKPLGLKFAAILGG